MDYESVRPGAQRSRRICSFCPVSFHFVPQVHATLLEEQSRLDLNRPGRIGNERKEAKNRNEKKNCMAVPFHPFIRLLSFALVFLVDI